MFRMTARVVENNGSIIGSEVTLSNGFTTLAGRVSSESVDQFVVEWQDGARSIESKSDYELVIATKTAAGICQMPFCHGVANEYGVCESHNLKHQVPGAEDLVVRGLPGSEDTDVLRRVPASNRSAAENPAQPAGWAVAPVENQAYPNGELFAVEMEKRNETAGWTDAQNRAPVDGENPAQPGGWAVPPASGQPIPGQGADGLMMAASVHAEDASGHLGFVQIANGNVRVAGLVLASDEDSFIVEWEDGRRTVETKSDYDLVITPGITAAIDSADKELTLRVLKQQLQRNDLEGQAGYAPTKRDQLTRIKPDDPRRERAEESERLESDATQLFKDVPGAADLSDEELTRHMEERGIRPLPWGDMVERQRSYDRAERRMDIVRKQDRKNRVQRKPAKKNK